MDRLQQAQFETVKPLFSMPHLNFVMEAMVAGNTPARMWVDDTEAPQSVFVWGEDHCCYLGGDAKNDGFGRDLRQVFVDEVVPEAMARNLDVFKLYCDSNGWDVNDLFTLTHQNLKRCFYAMAQSKELDLNIPEGFFVQQIDRACLESSLGFVDDLREEIESCWPSLDDFLKTGFGFVTKSADDLVCWCTGEYVSNGKCGIGIETVKKYQKQGFGTLTAAAFVEHCASKGIIPHWDSWADNMPSIAVAEKVGFEKVLDYEISVGKFEA